MNDLIMSQSGDFDQNLKSQLSEKVRAQASRLKVLEARKLDWDKFLTNFFDITEWQAMPEGEVLVAVDDKLRKLEEDNEELKQLMKWEVITCEQQRAYIEWLKDGMNIHLEDLGLENGNPDLLTNYTKLQAQYEVNKREVLQLKAKNADQDFQIQRINGKLENELDEKHRVQEARNELEQEYTAASEVIEDLKVKSDSLEQECARLQPMEAQFLEFRDKKENYEARISYLMDQSKAQKEQLESNFEQLKNLELENTVLKEDNISLQENVKAYSAEINELRTVKDTHENQIENLSRDNQDLHQTVDRLNNQVAKLNVTIENQLKKISATEEKLSDTENDLINNKASAEILDRRLNKSKDKLNTTREKYRAAKSQALEWTQSLEATNQSKREKDNEIIHLTSELERYEKQQLKKETFAKQAEKNKRKYQGLVGEMTNLQDTYNTLRNRESQLSIQVKTIGIEKEYIQMELDSVKQGLQEERRSNVELRELRASNAQKLSTVEQGYESKNSALVNAETKLEKLRQVNLAHQNKIDELVYYQGMKDEEIARQHETISRMRNHSDTLQQDLMYLNLNLSDHKNANQEMMARMSYADENIPPWAEGLIRQMTGCIGNFVRNVRVMMSSSGRYASILSTEMRGFIERVRDMPHGDLNLCHDWIMISVAEIEAMINRLKGTETYIRSPQSVSKKSTTPLRKPPLANLSRSSIENRMSPDMRFYDE